jgi:peptidoglycan/LPS O-acetylase OafA/YrhL
MNSLDRSANNFDLLRLVLATVVAFVHFSDLTGLELVYFGKYLSSGVAVDSFFIISGFLIFMSYESSNSLSIYFQKRLRRILPAYIAVIIICSVLLYLISSKSFSQYFNLEFFKYILFNVLTLNFLQPTLPGVFVDHHIPAVNGALWTIKIELMFYCCVPIIFFIMSKINRVFTFFSIYLSSVIYSVLLTYIYAKTGHELYDRLERQLPGQLCFFVSGGFLYMYYSKIMKYNFILLFISILIVVIHKYYFNLYLLYPFTLAFIVIYFANIFPCLGKFGKFGDFSFGIYIWHFPVLQTLIKYELFSNKLFGFTLFITVTFLASLISWNLIEKKFLYTKQKIS